jgi:hypothetical protein
METIIVQTENEEQIKLVQAFFRTTQIKKQRSN